jgi:hypothetical protein
MKKVDGQHFGAKISNISMAGAGGFEPPNGGIKISLII